MAYAKFDPDKSDLKQIALKYHGNISAIARHFNIHGDTVYEYIKRDPVGKEIIDFCRAYNTEYDLDLAEHVIRHNMANYKSNPGLAQRAAEKVIDKKGHLRGWVAERLAQEDDETLQLLKEFQSLQDHVNRSPIRDPYT